MKSLIQQLGKQALIVVLRVGACWLRQLMLAMACSVRVCAMSQAAVRMRAMAVRAGCSHVSRSRSCAGRGRVRAVTVRTGRGRAGGL